MLGRLFFLLGCGVAILWALPWVFLSIFMPMALIEQWSDHSLLPKVFLSLSAMTGWVFCTVILFFGASLDFIVRGRNRTPIAHFQKDDVFWFVGGLIVLNCVFTMLFFMTFNLKL